MTDITALTGLFTALGADDAEAEENIPQLARYRFLRMVWQDIDGQSAAAPSSGRWLSV